MKNEAPIGPDRLRRARQDLNRYREGKANLERRVIENEQWYRLRHWECIRRGAGSQVEPTSGWLFNAIANKHAEAMDNYPSPNVLPREEGDREKAQALGSILPVILQQEDFEDTYDRVMDDKLKSGTGIYGVFWDPEKLEGLGDISIRRVDILNLYWEGGITDIQQSRNVFYLRLWDNDLLLERYPQLEGKLSGAAEQGNRYVYDDRVDTADKSAVIDWYYKKRQGRKTVLHYCKFVGDTVLFATENEEDYRDRGWYDHGLYPFVLDPMFRTAGSPCGFGYIDVAKSAQEYVDRGNQAILQNLLANARPRHFIRADGAVNEEEYADMTRDFVHVDGNLGEDSIKPISGKSLSDIYVTVIANKIDELKEVTGTRDVTTGGTVHGVTAASAIAAMQEAGSKLSRDSNMASYRAFRKVCLMAVELIRQFYDLPRAFRILGPQGGVEFITFSNAGLKPQDQGVELGVELGMRTPLFDIEISAEKQSPYSRLSQNEMAMQFYSAGLFDPARSTEALTALDMMDFNGKSALVEKVRQNGGRYQAELARPQVEPMAEGKMRLRSGDNASPV
mgnify:FL=1